MPIFLAVESLNTFGINGDSIFGEVNVLGVGDARQFLFCLKPKPQFSDGFKGSVGVGKLDIEWHSSMGEKGRLQTSQLQRMVRKRKQHCFSKLWTKTLLDSLNCA